MAPPTDMQTQHDHEKIIDRLESMQSGIEKGLQAIHEDIRRILVEVNDKYDDMKTKLHAQELARLQLETRLALVEKTSGENEALWKKVIYTAIGLGVIAVFTVVAGVTKAHGMW